MSQNQLLRPSQVAPVPLPELFDTDVELPSQAPEVRGITLDSRSVGPGDLYVALSGTRVHGAKFAAAAAAQGAVAVLTDEAGREQALASGLPVVVAQDARDAMADASATLFGHPSRQLLMFGITGTNGKTTTCFLLDAALQAAGVRVGTIGTIGFRLDGAELPSNRTTVTTPESPDLQGLLATMLERGARSVAMEVSSHALALQRVDHTGFDVAGFTNLGRDHLDFHASMEDYFEVKARLFEADHCRVAVISTDDEHGRVLADRIRARQAAGQSAPRLVTTGFGPSDHQILSAEPYGLGMVVHYRGPAVERRFTIDLPGDYNARNAVMALAMATEAELPDGSHLDVDRVIEGLLRAQVPGRMQLLRLPAQALPDGSWREAPAVYVDFAHTPQAIESAVRAAHPEPGGRTIVVVGAGGDRDQAKRGPMGAAAATGTGLVVVTDDNPRTEDPSTIRAAVTAGAVAAGDAQVVEVAGRRAAIAHALAQATTGDVVLVLGKGHEKGQTVGEVVHDFDDVEVTLEQWAALTRLEEDEDAQH